MIAPYGLFTDKFVPLGAAWLYYELWLWVIPKWNCQWGHHTLLWIFYAWDCAIYRDFRLWLMTSGSIFYYVRYIWAIWVLRPWRFTHIYIFAYRFPEQCHVVYLCAIIHYLFSATKFGFDSHVWCVFRCCMVTCHVSRALCMFTDYVGTFIMYYLFIIIFYLFNFFRSYNYRYMDLLHKYSLIDILFVYAHTHFTIVF